jgi:hypothetical protein
MIPAADLAARLQTGRHWCNLGARRIPRDPESADGKRANPAQEERHGKGSNAKQQGKEEAEGRSQQKKEGRRRRSPGFAVQPGAGPVPARLQPIWEEGIAAGTRAQRKSVIAGVRASGADLGFARSNGACITTIL